MGGTQSRNPRTPRPSGLAIYPAPSGLRVRDLTLNSKPLCNPAPSTLSEPEKVTEVEEERDDRRPPHVKQGLNPQGLGFEPKPCGVGVQSQALISNPSDFGVQSQNFRVWDLGFNPTT